MGLETGNYVGDLVSTNPASGDLKSQGDDHLRLIKLALLQSFAGYTGAITVTGTDGGAANAYTLTPTTALVAYGTKMAAVFAPTNTNTGASTLNISGLGTKAIKRVDGSDVVANDLASGSIYIAIYNGTEFRLIGPTKNYIDQTAFSSALPAQPGGTTTYKLNSTNGIASWAVDAPPVGSTITLALNFGGF
jgi:hypothetical protein